MIGYDARRNSDHFALDNRARVAPPTAWPSGGAAGAVTHSRAGVRGPSPRRRRRRDGDGEPQPARRQRLQGVLVRRRPDRAPDRRRDRRRDRCRAAWWPRTTWRRPTTPSITHRTTASVHAAYLDVPQTAVVVDGPRERAGRLHRDARRRRTGTIRAALRAGRVPATDRGGRAVHAPDPTFPDGGVPQPGGTRGARPGHRRGHRGRRRRHPGQRPRRRSPGRGRSPSPSGWKPAHRQRDRLPARRPPAPTRCPATPIGWWPTRWCRRGCWPGSPRPTARTTPRTLTGIQVDRAPGDGPPDSPPRARLRGGVGLRGDRRRGRQGRCHRCPGDRGDGGRRPGRRSHAGRPGSTTWLGPTGSIAVPSGRFASPAPTPRTAMAEAMAALRSRAPRSPSPVAPGSSGGSTCSATTRVGRRPMASSPSSTAPAWWCGPAVRNPS